MAALGLRDLARVIALRGETIIEDEPVLADNGRWALYRGKDIVRQRNEHPMYILYLSANCPTDAVLAAAAALPEPAITEVLYPQSLESRIRHNDDIQYALHRTAYRGTTSQYLFSCFSDALVKFRDKILGLDPKYFVDPPVNAHGTDRSTRSLIDHFHDSTAGNRVGVLLADAGQGKTYMTQRLAAKLIPSGKVPIYVNSRPWAHMAPESLADLWKVIAVSFDTFDAPMPWITGSEYDFFNVTLKAGLFTLIFDGFDEYAYWNRGRVDAREAMEALAQLAEEADTPMLITARTTFWENDVARNAKSLPPHVQYHLLPFERNHARTYFNTRFVDRPQQANLSLRLFDSLHSTHDIEGKAFVGRGFVLSLLADLVDRTDTMPQLPTADSVTRRVMYALCEREQTRQTLPLTAEQQLQIFGTFAEQVAAGAAASTELLVAAISFAVTLDDDQIRYLVGSRTRHIPGKLASHALLEYVPQTKTWQLRQEQVFYNLLAEQLLMCASPADPILREFVEKILPDPKLRAEIATVLVDQVCASETITYSKVRIREMIARLLGHRVASPTRQPMPERDLAVTLAIMMVNRYVPAGTPREQRTAELVSYFPGQQLRALQFSGTIGSLSLKQTTFRDCRFEAVTWVNCEVNRTTVFDHCRFIGGRLENCVGFGRASFDDSWFDSDAAMLFESQQVMVHMRPYMRNDLKRDIGLLANKFASRDGFAVKEIDERLLRRGRFSNSPRREEIIETFYKHAFASRRGAKVAFLASARNDLLFWLHNGTLIGALGRIYDELAAQIDDSAEPSVRIGPYVGEGAEEEEGERRDAEKDDL